ncbi:enoyl-CoA hydratase/isomerase family protein [Rhodococcus sp. NPDC003318]|uniref:enoyl-CoA hydratase/isomerase family protein n=1 Tax=Rhodococcus sp. NPDC003318 TaxID=3364503 RepID=UPI0036BF1076
MSRRTRRHPTGAGDRGARVNGAAGHSASDSATRTEVLSTLDVEWGDTLVTLRFNRPDEHNCTTPDSLDELHQVLTRLSSEDGISTVVITGSGRMFCPGANVNRDHDPEPHRRRFPEEESYQVATLLTEMPQLTVAAVNGGCAGAGFAIASACDVRVASSRARFLTAFLQIGLASELGLPATLQRNLGGALARELCFLPETFDAERARAIGFVSRVFDENSWEQDFGMLRSELAGRSVEAVRMLKQNFLDAARLPLRDFVEIEGRRHRSWFDGERGAAAFERLAAQGREVRTPERASATPQR